MRRSHGVVDVAALGLGRRSVRLAGAVLGLILAGTLGCRKAAPADDADDERVENGRVIFPPNSPALGSVSTATVQPTAAAAEAGMMHLNGRLAWNEDATVRVFSPLEGTVVRVKADAGQWVHAGDTLALIAAPEFGQAQADARRATTDVTLAERTLARTKDLFVHGVVAQKDVEAAEADAARARAESRRARLRLAMYGGDSASADQVFPLRAPLGGSVVERNITPGEQVRPDQMLANSPQLFAPLFIVTNPSTLWLQLDVPERDLLTLRTGTAVMVRVRAWPEQIFPGRIVFVGGAVDSATRTVKVRAVVDNPRHWLKAEMLVTVDVPGIAPAGLAVPATAVLLDEDKHFVFVEEGRGRYRRSEVTIGAQRDSVILVSAGLRPGDRVVTGGSLLLEQLIRQNSRS